MIIFLGLLLSSTVMVALISLSSSLSHTIKIQNEDLQMADIIFSVADKNNPDLGIKSSIIDEISSIEGLKAIGTYKSSISIELVDEKGEIWTKNCFFQNLWNFSIDKVKIVKGRSFLTENEHGLILSEYLWNILRQDFSESIALAKNLTVTLLGKEISLPLIGVGYNPRLWNFAYISTGLMHELNNNTHLINTIAIRLTSDILEEDLQLKVNEILEILEPNAKINKMRIQLRNESLTPQVIRGVEKLSGIIGTGTLTIGLILTYYIMLSNVHDQRKEIAIMRSSGATHYHIILFYTSQALIIGMIAWIVGIFIGIPIGYIGLDLLSEAERLSGSGIYYINLGQIVILIILSLVMITVATLYPAIKASTFPIISVLKGEESDVKERFLPNIIFSRYILPSFRYASINIFSNIKPVIMRVITVVAISALAFAMISLSMNFRNTLEFVTEEEYNFDLVIQFSPYAPEEFTFFNSTYSLSEILSSSIGIDNISTLEFAYGEIGRFVINNNTTSSNYWIFGIDNSTQTIQPKLLKGNWITKPNEILLSEKIARDLKMDVGDTLTLSIPGKKLGENDLFRVVGIVFTLWQFGDTIYCERNSLQSSFGITNRINVALIKLVNSSLSDEIKYSLIKNLELEAEITGGIIMTKLELEEMLFNIRDSVSLLLILVIFILLTCVLFLILIMTNLDLARRIREVATMKSIGLTVYQSFKIIAIENIILNGISILIGSILIGNPIFDFLHNEIHRNVVPILYSYNSLFLLWISILLTLLLTISSTVLFTMKVNNTPVTILLSSGDIRG